MALPPPKICRRIHRLHAMLGSSMSGERESAHKKLTETLAEYGLNWNDLPEILAAVEQHRTSAAASTSPTAKSAPTSARKVKLLDLADRLRDMIAVAVLIVFLIGLSILALALVVWSINWFLS
jgi:hypothetical protein